MKTTAAKRTERKAMICLLEDTQGQEGPRGSSGDREGKENRKKREVKKEEGGGEGGMERGSIPVGFSAG